MKEQKIKLNQDQLKELVEYLMGSSYTLDEGLSTIGVDWYQLDQSSFDAIDALIFQCEICNWWMDAGEDAGNSICFKCQEEQDEDEDDDELIDYAEDEGSEF